MGLHESSMVNRAVAAGPTRSALLHLRSGSGTTRAVHKRNRRHYLFLSHWLLASLLLLSISGSARADDGYRLWLRYDPIPATSIGNYRAEIKSVVVPGSSATCEAIRSELTRGLSGLLGTTISTDDEITDGGIIVVTPESASRLTGLARDREPADLGSEGYRIHAARINGRSVTIVAASSEVGALYGAFHLLRLVQTLQPIEHLDIRERPQFKLRMLDHWDNLNGTIERGYAGSSLWNWQSLPNHVDQRLIDYARADASLGINGVLLNNVNADARILTAEYLQKVAAIAAAFRPYGLRVYLAARFSAPMDLDKLPTADPLDKSVADWWKRKADQIYQAIPDFGGWVVKANSEGQPGPRTYNRSHVDGANMLAAALASHRGIVIWRAFVYDMKPGYDRAGAAYENLHPFDGKFAANVLLQVKNGPIDFQPREPFHPLFGSMPKTQVVPELQITQEYLGFSNHLVFLATMWREFLDSDTYAKGPGSTVARVADGSLYGQRLTGIAGVANTGSDRNWTGHHFAQANWYAFGRLAWNPGLSPAQIADEWIRMTLTTDPATVRTITGIMLGSHEAVVDYMTPLGLHHLMWGGHHYGPAPWWNSERREDQNPTYFHRADKAGLGFDRTATGSDTLGQYHRPVQERFGTLASCPEEFLLWFHHVSWDYRMRSVRTMWEELCEHYQRGVEWTRQARQQWQSLRGAIDQQRFAEVDRKLAIQERDAAWWRDACLLYFQTFSQRPLPPDVEKPARTLAEYEAKSLDW